MKGNKPKKPRRAKHNYTYTDEDGMDWRFEGSRPISKLADQVMDKVFNKRKKK